MTAEITGEQLDTLHADMQALVRIREQAQPNAKAADGGRYSEASDGSAVVATKLVEASEQTDAKAAAALKATIDDAVKAALRDLRSPSMAAAIGPGPVTEGVRRERRAFAIAHPALKASLGDDYTGGALVSAIAMMTDMRDDEGRANAKATLSRLGLDWADVPSESKATLGETGAHGGYVLPNNLVDTVIKPATQKAVYQNLVTVRNGVAVRGVDQPFRTGAPSAATFQDWGATKTNVDEAYGSYTALLGTLGVIYDVGNQYLRFSAGSAEADIMDEITKAMVLGENKYIIAGAGTGSSGVGDPTTGVYTALNARPGFKAAFASASTTTVAGSFAAACSTLIQNVAANNREVDAIVTDAVTYFSGSRQGADAAGFWVNPAGGPTGFTLSPSGQLHFWNVPIYFDTNLGTNATTKIAIGAQWDQFKLYRGMEFRIDSSNQAGTRWDKNETGFRGEEEIGFHAGSAVEVGAAFLLTSVIP